MKESTEANLEVVVASRQSTMLDDLIVAAGSPDQVIERIYAYGSAGVDEIIVQRMDLADVEGLQIIAEEVMPRV